MKRDKELDGSAGRKGLCGHTGEQSAVAGADVKLILSCIDRVMVLWTEAALLCLLLGSFTSQHLFYER